MESTWPGDSGKCRRGPPSVELRGHHPPPVNDRSSLTGLLATLTPIHRSVDSSRRWRWCLLLVVTLATLWAGLDPKDYRFHNEVSWLPDRPGLRFGKYGRVHTEPFLEAATTSNLNRDGFTFNLAINPSATPGAGFRTIAAFHAGDDRTQLVIGQWRDFLIVMNGDDYDSKRRRPRVTADTSLIDERPLLVTIASTTNGTSLYLNGERADANARLHLTLPSTPEPGRLVLGDSVNASQPWTGDLTFCELQLGAVSARDAQAQYQRWQSGEPGSTGRPATSLLRHTFTAKDAPLIPSQGSLAEPLIIPPRLHALGARSLAWDLPTGTSDRGLALDVAVNFLGFMPFGFAFALMAKPYRGGALQTLLFATCAGFALSLVIELTQAWLPSRDSSLRDLLLNTAGSPAGACLLLIASRYTRPVR